MTAKVVNLRQKRKQVAKSAQQAAADQNAVSFGTPKHLKDLQKAQESKAARMHDLHKRDV